MISARGGPGVPARALNRVVALLVGRLGLPIPAIDFHGPSASAVILATEEGDAFRFEGLNDALALGNPDAPVDIRLFGTPNTLNNRRMGVALARAPSAEQAAALAVAIASRIRIRYLDDAMEGA